MTQHSTDELRQKLWEVFESVPLRDAKQPTRGVAQRFVDALVPFIRQKELEARIDEVTRFGKVNAQGVNFAPFRLAQLNKEKEGAEGGGK